MMNFTYYTMAFLLCKLTCAFIIFYRSIAVWLINERVLILKFINNINQTTYYEY